jgi:hypothetical protein
VSVRCQATKKIRGLSVRDGKVYDIP